MSWILCTEPFPQLNLGMERGIQGSGTQPSGVLTLPLLKSGSQSEPLDIPLESACGESVSLKSSGCPLIGLSNPADYCDLLRTEKLNTFRMAAAED